MNLLDEELSVLREDATDEFESRGEEEDAIVHDVILRESPNRIVFIGEIGTSGSDTGVEYNAEFEYEMYGIDAASEKKWKITMKDVWDDSPNAKSYDTEDGEWENSVDRANDFFKDQDEFLSFMQSPKYNEIVKWLYSGKSLNAFGHEHRGKYVARKFGF